MEAMTISAIIGGVVTYIGNQLAKNNSISELLTKCTDGTAKWLKNLLFKEDGNPKEELQKLKDKPDSDAKKEVIQSMMKSQEEDNPEVKNYILEIYKNIKQTAEGEKIFNIITDSENVVTGTNTAGGNFVVGNHNKL